MIIHLVSPIVGTASIDAFQEAKLAEDPILSSEAETARNLLKAFQAGERSITEIFDVELWGRFFALHDLWSAPHGVLWHNLRFYYNPITALLEPVAFDSEPFYHDRPRHRFHLNSLEQKYLMIHWYELHMRRNYFA